MLKNKTVYFFSVVIFQFLGIGYPAFSQTAELPFSDWIQKLDATDYQHKNFYAIREALGNTDSAGIFKNIELLEKQGGYAGSKFHIRLKMLRAYKLFDIDRKNNFRQIDSILKSALYNAYETDDDYLAAEISRILGHTLMFNGNGEEGISYCINATDIQDRIGQEQFPNTPLTRRLLGEYLYERLQYDEARHYLEQAIDFGLEKTSGKKYVVNMLNTIGLCWQKTGRYDSAMIVFKQAQKMALELNDTLWLGILAGSIGDMYLAENKTEAAGSFLQEYYSVAVKYSEWANAANALQLLSRIQLSNTKTDSAILNLRKALSFLVLWPEPFYMQQALKNMTTAWEQKKNGDSAYHYFKLYAHLHDSLTLAIQASTTRLARIKSVHERNIYRIQAIQKEKRSEIIGRNMLIILIVIVSLLVILYLNRKRLVSKWKEEQALHQKSIAEAETLVARERMDLFTQNIIEKTRLVEKLQEQLENYTVNSRQLQIIDELSGQVILTENDWQKFRTLFEQIYPGFFKSLIEKAIDITAAEQRMAALIRLHLTTKQMAAMLGISPDSVNKSRQRLRSRLKIPLEKNLAEIVADL